MATLTACEGALIRDDALLWSSISNPNAYARLWPQQRESADVPLVTFELMLRPGQGGAAARRGE